MWSLSRIIVADFEELMGTQLTYGHIWGSPKLRGGIAKLYEHAGPDNVLVSGGAIGANFLVFYSLVEPGDTVVSIFPAYQQLYSTARSFGAKVRLLTARASGQPKRASCQTSLRYLDNSILGDTHAL